MNQNGASPGPPILLREMLVETPVREADIIDREFTPGRETENQCSYCGVGASDPWYDVRDIMTVRHWTTSSRDTPGGGHWTWYCPEHFARRRGNWWKASHLAPDRLKPAVRHSCARVVQLGEKCGSDAVEPFDGVWMCAKHANVERVDRRLRELLHPTALPELGEA